ncbi:hypothetical protein Zm00014a_001802 [Zea mays]|uniref:60S ribosomal protein L41 n=1 Tax=Zea mays TaxID=4577 RepID=A0A3L6E1M8_MAIZE|nr:hypothetical protein Zm00014a_001802 [Zea mays]
MRAKRECVTRIWYLVCDLSLVQLMLQQPRGEWKKKRMRRLKRKRRKMRQRSK